MRRFAFALTDFLTNGTGLDLTDIEAVRFEGGPSFGSPEGRLGLDDIELTADRPPNVFISISIDGGAPDHIAPGVETSLVVRIYGLNEEYVPDTARLHYRYDGGEYMSVALLDLGEGPL